MEDKQSEICEYDGYKMLPHVEPTPEVVKQQEEAMKRFIEESKIRMKAYANDATK